MNPTLPCTPESGSGATAASEATARRVLCISAADEHRELGDALREHGWLLEVVSEPRTAIAEARSGRFRCGVVFVDPAQDPGWLDQTCGDPRSSEMRWIALASPGALRSPRVIQFVAERCWDFHTLPADLPRMERALGHAIGMADLAEAGVSQFALGPHAHDGALIAESAAMRPVLRNIAKFAGSDLPVLIGGESGTGKERIALALHTRSRRASGPFIAVNCASLAPGLIQSELFGHEKGAFTGAHRARTGRIEAARGGTILLDEVGDLPGEVQVSLLRFLQERTIERVGGTGTIEVDVRVIAATHVDLEAAVVRGNFREDLYYRLNVLRIAVPALRRRPEDLPVLALHFLEQRKRETNVLAQGFSKGGMRALTQHCWPGNVRELQNRVSNAAVICGGRLLTRADLGLQETTEPRHLLTLKDARDGAERQAIMASLESVDGNVTRAAKVLGVSRIHLHKLIERHGIGPRRSD